MKRKSIEKILSENSIIFNESEDGNIVISGLYSGFKPYRSNSIDIVDLYSQHLEKGYDNTFRQGKILSKEEYLDKLNDDCDNAWDEIEDRKEESIDKKNEDRSALEDAYKKAFTSFELSEKDLKKLQKNQDIAEDSLNKFSNYKNNKESLYSQGKRTFVYDDEDSKDNSKEVTAHHALHRVVKKKLQRDTEEMLSLFSTLCDNLTLESVHTYVRNMFGNEYAELIHKKAMPLLKHCLESITAIVSFSDIDEMLFFNSILEALLAKNRGKLHEIMQDLKERTVSNDLYLQQSEDITSLDSYSNVTTDINKKKIGDDF